MDVKIFWENEGNIEEKINEWFEKNPEIEVVHTNVVVEEIKGQSKITVFIFYE